MKEHKYVPITLGWTVKRNTGELQGNVSYRNIAAENTVHDPDDYTIVHTITIENNTVFLNGKYIVGAPAGKTKAFKEKFCKAVVWSLLNDDQGLKDKLKEKRCRPFCGGYQCAEKETKKQRKKGGN